MAVQITHARTKYTEESTTGDGIGVKYDFPASSMSVHYVDVEEGRLPLTFSHVTKDLEKSDEKNKVKRHSIHGMMEEENVIRPHQEMAQLSLDEKKFLLAVERGDVASTRRTLQKAQETDFININCVDPLGRSALLMAIDNENLEMVELLIEHKVETKDALLHAISEEFVEAVEVLLDHENTIHQPGEPHHHVEVFPNSRPWNCSQIVQDNPGSPVPDLYGEQDGQTSLSCPNYLKNIKQRVC
ncbi:hypothetical protein RUM44_006903, partial [Polyplax serrata]